MKRRIVLTSIAALAIGATALTALFGGSASAQEGPNASSSIASGLSSTGATIGPDGALYVAVAGTGGDEALTLTPEEAEAAGVDTVYFGLTGSVARVTSTGDVTTHADGLPSWAFGEPGEGAGAADVAFNGSTLYALVTSTIATPEYPNGIYELQGDGTWDVFADLSAFADDNPVSFPDAVPGGNPFAIETRGSGFIVSDGNYNRLLSVSSSGAVSILAAFDNVVPTGLALESASGPVFNTWFSAFPHEPADSKVQQVAVPGGAVTTLASGYSQMIDIEFTEDGSAYVLQFGDQQLDENAPPPPGRLLRLGDDGTLTPVVEGYMLPTSLSFVGDDAFVTSLTGEVWWTPGVNDLAAIVPPPEPTVAAPTTTAPLPTPTSSGIVAPDTGTGPGDGGSASPWLLAMLAAGGAIVLGGAALKAQARTQERRSR